MKEQSSEQILGNIQDAYYSQFEQKLDNRLLNYVVEKEIQKKHEAFLQVQLATSCQGLEGLIDLKKYLQKSLKSKEEATSMRASTPAKVAVEADASPFSLGSKEEEAEFEGDMASLSEDEVKQLKRRAYARAYYHRKKGEKEERKAGANKPFKTTPEQRAYQRAYYKRKKAERVAVDNQNSLTKALAASLEGRLRLSSAEGKNQEPRRQSLHEHAASNDMMASKKPFVDYDSLTSDRMAIESAFRADALSSVGFSSFQKQESHANNSLSYPKTKLRKAKSSGLGHSS